MPAETQPLWSRKLDIIYLVFFITHIPIILRASLLAHALHPGHQPVRSMIQVPVKLTSVCPSHRHYAILPSRYKAALPRRHPGMVH